MRANKSMILQIQALLTFDGQWCFLYAYIYDDQWKEGMSGKKIGSLWKTRKIKLRKDNRT